MASCSCHVRVAYRRRCGNFYACRHRFFAHILNIAPRLSKQREFAR